MNNFDSMFVSCMFLIIGLAGGWGAATVSLKPIEIEITRTKVETVVKHKTEYKTKVVTVREKEVIVEKEIKDRYCKVTRLSPVFGIDGNNKGVFGLQIAQDLTTDFFIGAQVLNNGTYLGTVGFSF